jgi:thymidylate synthase ThyX
MSQVFCLTDENGKLLDPAVQATVLAKYSRSPLSAKEIVSTLTAEEADKFQDKWFVSYGHSSIAELANIPICFEGVSIVASKFLESFQRPGYSEKSTRYQVFSGESFVLPPGCPATMKAFSKRLYDAYDRIMPRVVKRCAALMGKDPEDPGVLEDRTVKARAFDNVRYLLPAGTGTNLAWVGNARDARYMVSAALGHRNPEIREIGEKAKAAISELCPVFMNNAEPDDYEPPIRTLGPLPDHFSFENPGWYVDVHRPHLQPKPDLVQASFESMVADMYAMSWSVFKAHMDSRGKRGVPRVFRKVPISFEIMMDYGAYRDLQRHRRCEIFPEVLTANYGFLVPDDIAGTDIEPDYREAMELVDAYKDEAVTLEPELLQYLVPLGYLHRSIFDMDLAEVYYITELRTQPQGHISYRRVAYEMFRKAAGLHPGLLQWCRAIEPAGIGVHA